MFSGLSAFPLTPLHDNELDEEAFIRLVQRLAAARVDSICALGSTGSYAYLRAQQRARIAQLAVQHADGMPVIVGIGALTTHEVLLRAEDAQKAGAKAVLLAPMSYQQLTENEVFDLYATVTRALSVPLIVYDNPGTTHFAFSDALHGRIAQLPGIASIKIPPVMGDLAAARARISALRALMPAHVTLGISGDAAAANGLTAGCDAWYSVIGGLFPQTALAITRAARARDAAQAQALSARLEPLWTLFRRHGSLRVIAAAAELLGYVYAPCLPLPLQALQGPDRQELATLLSSLALA